MAGELVLITGGTGHVGYRVIVEALKAGYSVRAAVRSTEKGQKILDAPTVRGLATKDNIELVTVPDLLAKGAYDDAIRGASYAIHIASPLASRSKPGDDLNKLLIEPAVQGTLSLLESAKKAPSVKRVVITSSILAILPLSDIATGKSTTVYDEKSRTPFVPPPPDNAFAGYAASKIKALNETEAWVQKEKPSFDVVNIFPSFIIGGNELAADAAEALQGSNGAVLGPVTGQDSTPRPNASIHLYDVALAHVKALNKEVPGNQGYLLTTETFWETGRDIVNREFKEAVEDGRLKNNGKIDSVPMKADQKRSEELLGMKFLGFEEQVRNVVGHYLTLV